MGLNKKNIGLLLLIVGVVSLFLFTPFGTAFVGDSPEIIAPSGQKVSCQTEIDKDSIIKSSCNVVGVCRDIDFLLFSALSFNPFVSDVNIRLLSADSVQSTKSFSASVFGKNKIVALDACVPAGVSTGFLELYNADGGVLATLEVGW